MSNLTFDTASHQYYLDGKPIPSVTQILQDVRVIDFSGIDVNALEYAADRGSKVHRACELEDLGDLADESVDPVVRPYLEAWRKFKKECMFVSQVVERAVYDEIRGYAGTPDRVGLIGFVPAVIDIKTSQPYAWHSLQLAAYQALLGPEIKKRVGVYLSNNGTYCVEEYKDRADIKVFYSALSTYQWKKSKGVNNVNIVEYTAGNGTGN